MRLAGKSSLILSKESFMLPRSLSRYFLMLTIPALVAVLAFAACDDDEDDGGVTPGAGETPVAGGTPAGIDLSGVPELEDGVLNFVAYITVGTGIVVPAGNPNNIHGLDDLCGLTVAVQVGTIQVDMLNEQNDKCAEPIDVVTFDTNPLAVEDLRTGGADANFSDFPVAAEDAAQSGGDLEVVDPQVAPEPYGIGLRKESTELNDVIADAIQAIRDSGKYDQILAEWELEAVALR